MKYNAEKESAFQSLIGKLQTKNKTKNIMVFTMFQSLIGKLQTGLTGTIGGYRF